MLTRIVLAGVVVMFTYQIVRLPFMFVMLPYHQVVVRLISLALAGLMGWAMWNRVGETYDDVARYTIRGAFIVGGIGFLAGFVGPMILAPGANQGPMLGIFLTGPIGYAIGILGGLLFGLARRHVPA